jgi:hypothetical protein
MNRALWFMICSGIVLLVGLELAVLPRRAASGLDGRRSDSKRRVWLAIGGLVVASGAALGWLWPSLLTAALYGAIPGLVIVLFLLLSQWLLHERYKRQLLFMPGFTRIKGGSSLIKSTSNNRGAEQSTIDAPQVLDRSSGGSDQ